MSMNVTISRIGVQGPAGPGGDGQSVPGPEGASAYEVAVANGFVGTEPEWLASLKGAPGADGPAAATTVLTQAQYDALPSEEPGTLYIVRG